MNINKYTAKNIKLLEGIDHVRLRPSMYIGDTGIKGLHHLIYEIIDNSIDEALAGFCNKISIILENHNNYITIIDNGRGIPIDMHEQEMKTALELVMTKIGAGGKFDQKSYKISGGLHGIGLSCVNALSEKLIARIYRNKTIYEQKYKKGVPINKIKKIGHTNKRGTSITFKPDKSIFQIIDYKYDKIASRLRELSYLNKGIKIFLIDNRDINNTKKQLFFSNNGIKEFIDYIDNNKNTINNTIYIKQKKKKIDIEIALRYNTSYREKTLTYVNNINTKEGGSHLTGFRRALIRTFKKYAEEYKFINKKQIELNKEDLKEGLTAIISIKMHNPEFEGQTKTKLSNSKIIGIIDKTVSKKLDEFLQENPSESKKIINKLIISAKARYAAKKAKELIQKKENIIHGSLPGKLADCSNNKPELCEIYLVEGDSAGGTAKQGRDRNFQAILPLRGKILNVEKAINYKIFENEEIKNIFNALGVYIDPKNNQILNIDNLRYHKIIIMTDADIDGSHISTLLLTFFFKYLIKLIEKGFLYIATPPLFLIKNKKKNTYIWNINNYKKTIKKLKKIKSNFSIQRYKGLGEMNADQLWKTTMNPKYRTLKKIYIKDVKETQKTFSMLMGDNVLPRKKFIEKNAINAKINI